MMVVLMTPYCWDKGRYHKGIPITEPVAPLLDTKKWGKKRKKSVLDGGPSKRTRYSSWKCEPLDPNDSALRIQDTLPEKQGGRGKTLSPDSDRNSAAHICPTDAPIGQVTTSGSSRKV
ncbi:hypothetical protein L1987_16117 [Smallanthus sonchifolius]|uniref:Uncharacterized protein n=1 Tax=Smallanthus sonchifolius TaxID=185202 RepID=A0ACB9J9N2_9ASTR|nr:hypothetical protein L1987_16117 [Smallanthus sonchifolius]